MLTMSLTLEQIKAEPCSHETLPAAKRLSMDRIRYLPASFCHTFDISVLLFRGMVTLLQIPTVWSADITYLHV